VGDAYFVSQLHDKIAGELALVRVKRNRLRPMDILSGSIPATRLDPKGE
jgi:hypothetical protein